MAKDNHKLSALDRAIQTALGDGRKVGLESDPARQQFPNVWDWLTRTGTGGDYTMQPAQISIQLGPEGALVSITHRDLCVSCSIACPHLGDAIASLEAALAAPNAPLRYWGKKEPHLKKRKPKT